MSHVVTSPYFTSEQGRAAVNKRWQKYRMKQSAEHHQQRVKEYMEAQGKNADDGDPVLFLASVIADKEAPLDHRIVAARELLPYHAGPKPKEQPEPPAGADAEEADRRSQAYRLIIGMMEENTELRGQLAAENSAVAEDAQQPLQAAAAPYLTAPESNDASATAEGPQQSTVEPRRAFPIPAAPSHTKTASETRLTDLVNGNRKQDRT